MNTRTFMVFFTVVSLVRPGSAAETATKARPAAPRTITIKNYAAYPPVFATRADTLDPLALARESWKGWISKRGIPWGLTSDFEPTLRLPFDCRALPWPSLKTHSVDGPDNNMRTLGGLALLHAMLGKEFENDPAEKGIVGYLLSCTDPVSGIPYSPDSATRSCAIGHGEFAKNLALMNRHTARPMYLPWGKQVLRTLRYYAVETNEVPLGNVATYSQGGFTPGELPSTNAADRTLGGWLHLAVGWNLWGFTEWYKETGDRQYLDFATALGRRLCHGADPDGEDGCFRPDGSFGGKTQKNTASWHMHGHTHCLPGLSLLGAQLLKAGQREQGLQFINQASRTFDWLYDPERNPDAGSMTGWLGEWLMVATGWERQADCEGCTMGDVVQTACMLGAASRLDPSLRRFAGYYDRAEQIFTGQLIEQTFRLRPRYLEVLRESLIKRVNDEAMGAVVWQDQSAKSVYARLALGNVERVEGAFPRGPRPVLRFGGKEYFGLTNSVALRLPKFGIFAVVNTGGSDQDQSIYCNYDNPINWGKGINLQLNADRKVCFFTTDGTEAHYDPMTSSKALPEGYHILTATYDGTQKNIWVDGENAGSALCKGLDYGEGSVAAIGALREFGFGFKSDLAELIICDSVDAGQRAEVESYLSEKYGIAVPARPPTGAVKSAVLWLKAEAGFVRNTSKSSPEFKAAEVEKRYREAVKSAERMVGQQLGACGFPDWVNKLPSDLDPRLPGIHMQGCCADATVRGAHAIWEETVTGDTKEARVNLAFNRKSPLVEVVSCLPHRGELNVFVIGAKKVLIRVPEWATKAEVKAFRAKKPAPVSWEDNYVVFDRVGKGDQLTVTWPLRIAEVKETVGSLDGTQYTERWRGNTIVDISPPGKWIPLFQRPELDLATVPVKGSP